MTTTVPDVQRKTRLTLSGVQTIAGYRFGFAQPCALTRVDVDPGWRPEPALAGRLWAAITEALPERYHTPAPPQDRDPLLSLLAVVARLVGVVQDSIGLPVLDPGKVLALQGSGGGQTQRLLALPSFAPKAAELVALELLRLVGVLGAATPGQPLAPEELARFDRMLDVVSQLAPQGTNTHRLLRGALQRNIPTIGLPGGVWQFGWGCNARLFKSTLSDVTSAIGTGWAKDKVQTNQILRMAGLPVPEQVFVADLEAALGAARRIGFPVVLKPADLDQGLGVEAGLATEADVRAAFARVSGHGRRVLLERHVEGNDFRIDVINGKFEDAIARYPAAVTGDGVQTVLALVAQVNKDPRRSLRRFADMKPIVVNDEARELLAAQGLSETSVPEAGRLVRLRRAANVSSGGDTRGVSHELHPDNARLCEQAARVLRLDIAGIDLLIPDHRKSWREVGGAICEVNAQPQVGLTYPEIYDHLFDAFVVGEARIPVAYVLTDDAAGAAALGRAFAREGEPARCRVVTDLGGQPRAGADAGAQSGVQSVRAAVLDPTCAALVILSDGHDIGRIGVPVDRVDLLWLAGWAGDVAQLRQRVNLIVPQLAPGDILADRQTAAQCGPLALPPTHRLRVQDHTSAALAVLHRLCPRAGKGAAC